MTPSNPLLQQRSISASRHCRRLLGALAVALVAVPLLAGSGAQARRQAAPAPFPAPLVAPVAFGDVDPELDLRGIALVDATDVNAPTIDLVFGGAFAPPSEDYRASVLVGDPKGPQTRVSYTSGGAGTTEQSTDGTNFTAVGEATVSFDAAGTITLVVPVADQADGAQVWAEVQRGDDTRITPLFSLSALLGRLTDGSMAAGTIGMVSDGESPTGETIELGAGPTLSIVNQGMTVSYTEAPPTELGGAPVVSVVDRVVIAPDYATQGTPAHSVSIDRTAQAVELVNGLEVPPAVVPGTDWFIGGFPPSGVGTLTFELGDIADSLGIDLLPDAVGVGIAREVTLEDGRVVTTQPVYGTLGWFGSIVAEAPTVTTTAPDSAEAAASDDDDELTTRKLVMYGAAAVAVILALAGIAMISSAFRNRRGHRILGEHADDRGVVDWTSEMEAITVTGTTPAVKAGKKPKSPPKGKKKPEQASPASRRRTPAPTPDTPPRTGDSDAAKPSQKKPASEVVGEATVPRADLAKPPEKKPAPGVVEEATVPRADLAKPPEKKPKPPEKKPAPAAADPLAALQASIGELSARLGKLDDDAQPAE